MCSNGQFKWLWQKRNEMIKILCYFSLALILPMGYAWLGGLEERIIFPIGTLSLYYFQSHPLLCFPLVKKIIMFMSSLPWTIPSFHLIVSWSFLSDLTRKLFGGVCYLCHHKTIPLLLAACILAPLFTLQLQLLTPRSQPPNDQIKSSCGCLPPGLHLHLVVDYPSIGTHFIALLLPPFCPFLSSFSDFACFSFFTHQHMHIPKFTPYLSVFFFSFHGAFPQSHHFNSWNKIECSPQGISFLL